MPCPLCLILSARGLRCRFASRLQARSVAAPRPLIAAFAQGGIFWLRTL